VSGDIFGLDKYFTETQNETAFTIKHSRDIEQTIKALMAFLAGHPSTDRIKTALRELIVNAVYYGARNEDGARKDEWKMDVPLVPDEYVTVRCLRDAEKAGMGIIDQKGRLKKADVLYWLERNIARDPVTGLVKSLEDEHGRGLFISREFIDSLIINVQPGVKTEIILLSYFIDKYKGFKPLIINEI
jgi:anti-sigma regulatory factor (Ser/Thr protein kinase)